MMYTSDKPTDDLHRTGCRRYRDISRAHPTATAEGADRVSAPHALKREAGFRARRWVVERTHSWLNRFRRILTRWEKRADTYLAMLHLACGLITWRANDWGHLPQ